MPQAAFALVAAMLPAGLAAQAPTHLPLRSMIPPRADETRALASGDLDGDGDLDLVVCEPRGPEVALWDDAGGFAELPGALPEPEPYLVGTDVVAGDLDGDGDLDVVETSQSLNRVWLNRGDATYDLVPWLTGGDVTNSAIALFDLENDGDLDVVTGGNGAWLWNNHTFGGFPAQPIPLATFDVRGIAVGDADGDGLDDVVLANFATQNQLFRSTGSSLAFVPGAFSPVELTYSVEAGDLDNDGVLDVVFGNGLSPFGTGPEQVFRGHGDGTFTLAPALPVDASTPATIRMVDLDLDLDLDLVVFGGDSYVLENLGGLVFADRSAAQGFELYSVQDAVTGDFDADGDPDLVAALWGANRLLLSSGPLSLVDVDAAVPMTANGVALGDLDADGDVDAFLCDTAAPYWQVAENDGGGELVPVASALPAAPASFSPYAVELGDVDADGDLDAFVGSVVGQDRLCRNQGGLAFTHDPADTPALSASAHALALGDVDGDGDLDAVIGALIGLDRLRTNDGTGVFTDVGTIGVQSGETTVVKLADLDLDGDLDLFRSFTHAATPSEWARNDGAGAFTAAITLPQGATGAFDGAVFDVDADGDVDVFLAAGTVQYFENEPAGLAFVDHTALLPPLALVSRLAVLDLDGDGDPDVVGANGLADTPVSVLANDGAGGFSDATGAVALETAHGVKRLAAADLDGDQDDDLLAGWAGTRTLTNVARQTARRRIASIGKPLALDVFGPAAEPWFLAASTASTALELPPFGVLRLSPVGLFLLASGVLDAGGQGGIAAVLPATPSLVGTTLYTQGLVGAAPRFTNLEPLSFVDL